MKDRLIELICNCPSKIMGANMFLEKISADLADYLLANGVIAPPCKVGDSVFRIVKMSTGITSTIRAIRKKANTTGIIQPCEPTIKRFIRCVTVTKNNFFDVCENFGKTVFLTKEEAEAALKGR